MAEYTYLTIAENGMSFSFSDVEKDENGVEHIMITIERPNPNMASGFSSANYRYPGTEMSNIQGFMYGELLWIRRFVSANAENMLEMAKSQASFYKGINKDSHSFQYGKMWLSFLMKKKCIGLRQVKLYCP